MMYYLVDVIACVIVTKSILPNSSQETDRLKWIENDMDVPNPKYDKISKKIICGYTLAEYKQILYAKVDSKTTSIIFRGFVFEGDTFCLSLEAQSRINNLLAGAALNALPDSIEWNTIDDCKTITLPKAKIISFCTKAIVETLQVVVTGGTSIKSDIRDMTTLEECFEFIDPRS